MMLPDPQAVDQERVLGGAQWGPVGDRQAIHFGSSILDFHFSPLG